jgi:DNA-binding winged helix-turn-helix (wHTH) protein
MSRDLVRVDVAARQAWLGGVELDLRPMEFRLLAVLVANAGRLVSYDQLKRRVWLVDWMPNRKSIIVTAMVLRRKLGDSHPFRYMKTVHGLGYRFEASMVAPAETHVVDIDGRRYDVLHWEKHPYRGADVTFTLHAREAVPDAR